MAGAFTARPGTARLVRIAAPIGVCAVVIAIWQSGAIYSLTGLDAFSLPKPSAILEAAVDARATLVEAAGDSVFGGLLGWALGVSLGFLFAIVLGSGPPSLSRAAMTAAGSLQAIPVVAIAPVMGLLFGPGVMFKVLTVAVLAAVPSAVYGLRGMASTPPAAAELLASMGSSHWQEVRYVRLPTMAPYAMASLRLSSIGALVGVVVCEVLLDRHGLGFLIMAKFGSFDIAVAWAAIATLAGLGIAFYAIVCGADRLLLPWAERNRPH